ncbi:hypothetical protein RRG08_020975 [Elysia crispata]|uniref:Uncharacterized protein n=1 Tax=Elysia crispata TaxID=231223 RepID=A0AAE0ZMY8_9GAST|nr:hypothetical protein RRG08_020975 [Elysia crispata]
MCQGHRGHAYDSLELEPLWTLVFLFLTSDRSPLDAWVTHWVAWDQSQNCAGWGQLTSGQDAPVEVALN